MYINIDSLIKQIINLKIMEKLYLEAPNVDIYIRRLNNRYNKSRYLLEITQDYDTTTYFVHRTALIQNIIPYFLVE